MMSELWDLQRKNTVTHYIPTGHALLSRTVKRVTLTVGGVAALKKKRHTCNQPTTTMTTNSFSLTKRAPLPVPPVPFNRMTDKQKVDYLLVNRRRDTLRQRELREVRFRRKLATLEGVERARFLLKTKIPGTKIFCRPKDVDELSPDEFKALLQASIQRFGKYAGRKRGYAPRIKPTVEEKCRPDTARPEVIETWADAYDKRLQSEKRWRKNRTERDRTAKRIHKEKVTAPPLDWTPPPLSPGSPSLDDPRSTPDPIEPPVTMEPSVEPGIESSTNPIPDNYILPLTPVPAVAVSYTPTWFRHTDASTFSTIHSVGHSPFSPPPLLAPTSKLKVIHWNAGTGSPSLLSHVLSGPPSEPSVFPSHNPFRDAAPVIQSSRPPKPVAPRLPLPVRMDLALSPPHTRPSVFSPPPAHDPTHYAGDFIMGTHPLDHRMRPPPLSF